MKDLRIEDLAVAHDYYCNENNYYSNEPRCVYDTFPDFYSQWNDADVDMNLVFRWDVTEYDELDGCGYYLEIFIMKQRKGIFTPIMVNEFTDDDVPDFLEYIKPHMEKLKRIWKPLNF